MFSRRAVLGAAGVGLTGVMAGCLDQVPFLSDEPLEFEATPASVPASIRDETGYEEQRVDTIVLEETVEAMDRRQDIVVTNWLAEYDKAVDLSEFGLQVDDRLEAAIFTVLSTPRVSILDRTFNPVGEMSSEDLLDLAQDHFDDVGRVEHVDERSVEILGESTTVGEFETTAELAGGGVDVDVTIHIAEAVESGDDLVVAVGGYPSVLDDHEREHVFSMMESIEHAG